jgi:hypothetical protein
VVIFFSVFNAREHDQTNFGRDGSKRRPHLSKNGKGHQKKLKITKMGIDIQIFSPTRNGKGHQKKLKFRNFTFNKMGKVIKRNKTFKSHENKLQAVTI